MINFVLRQTNITLAITKHLYVFVRNTQVINETMHLNVFLKASVTIIYALVVNNKTVVCNIESQ